MAYYETTFIARQDLSRNDITKLIETFTQIVDDNGGKVEGNEYWGLRTLAYNIQKSRKGHYFMLKLDAPANALNELQRNAHINEEVMRMLTVRVDALAEGPSAMMQQSRARDEYVTDESSDEDRVAS